MAVDPLRIRPCNKKPTQPGGRYVLYWMVTTRRPHDNFALDHAIAQARAAGKPLLVCETLATSYPWASDRLHRFMLQDMAANAEAFGRASVRFIPFVERPGHPLAGLIEALAEHAVSVVTDDYPMGFIAQMVDPVARRLRVRLEAVDSMGLLPRRAADRAFANAYGFRRYLQQVLPQHLERPPVAQPLRRAEALAGARVPKEVQQRWPAAPAALLAAEPSALAPLPIDHDVGPALHDGGWVVAQRALDDFLGQRLPRYGKERNHPDSDAASGLSPWLHFGHLSPHRIFAQLAQQEGWEPGRVAGRRANGAREGFWQMSEPAEAFIDEFVTWRELGQNTCTHRPEDFDRYESLPDWAQQTLKEHADDPREHTYSCAQLAASKTHDPIWNAAQTQLRREGRLHNYMRMLWGKRILTWTRTPQAALDILIELNNKYAVDGRDPNSYAGIFWVLGRYDRPWPSHPIFGKVRCMTSQSTQRKLSMRKYLAAYGDSP